jgi:hypothetical protein
VIRSSGLSARAGAIIGASNADKALYGAVRAAMSGDEYSTWDSRVWNTSDSSYLVKKTGKEEYTGDLILMKPPNGIATGDALLMHCALLARARGKTGFVLYPARPRLDYAFVRFVDGSDPSAPVAAMLDANTVVAALSTEFPDPSLKKH